MVSNYLFVVLGCQDMDDPPYSIVTEQWYQNRLFNEEVNWLHVLKVLLKIGARRRASLMWCVSTTVQVQVFCNKCKLKVLNYIEK